MTQEKEEIKLKNGKTIRCGDIVFISMSPDDLSVVAKGRFVELTKEGNVKFYVIDPSYKLVDVEVKQNRIVKIEKPN